MYKLSLVMPAYNEQNTLREIIEKIQESLVGIDFEIVIVNDGSKDKTQHIAEELAAVYKNIRVFTNEKNIGKSQTVKRGILESKGEYVVIQDADLEYNPVDLRGILNKIETEKLDVVYGNRFGYKNEVVYFQNWIGNTMLSMFSALITGLRANMWPRDMEVCYKMARGDMFRGLAKTLTSTTNFGFEPEISAKFSKVRGIKFAQVPIMYYPRTIAEGKKMNAFKHGWEALKEIIRYNFWK